MEEGIRVLAAGRQRGGMEMGRCGNWLLLVSVVWAALVTGGEIAGAAAPPVDRATGLMAKLQGVWVLEGLEVEGTQLLMPELIEGMYPLLTRTYTLRGEKLVVTIGKRWVVPCKVKIDASVSPKHLDVTGLDGKRNRETFRGIFALDGDVLLVSMARNLTDPRPTRFNSVHGCTVYLLRRKP
jgi:uncharacterized protein (TIGR03067 family)